MALGFGRLFTGRTRLRRADLWQLLQECGAEASWIVCLISLLTGMSTAFVGAIQLARFGAEIFVADLVALSTVREMAPTMTAFVMAGEPGRRSPHGSVRCRSMKRSTRCRRSASRRLISSSFLASSPWC
ncbi:ABC transporter permease [Defluviicoccus vanus]|uniref:ABC transporter permease n=1 Tax=Defluviicoccus vanus TaxID=111831 RepID=A0A7H1MY78_9PROT|nr:ABC transporter permease [Defluviicoccus vanus]QNT68414.1 ABC transporter permease [Defluviicoccus vanus]